MKLWRTKDGRYLAGVHITKNEMAQYIASVYFARDENGEILTELMKTLPAMMTSQDAMRADREWALANLDRGLGNTATAAAEVGVSEPKVGPPKRAVPKDPHPLWGATPHEAIRPHHPR